MEKLNQIRYVTENFYSLQGLRYIPALLFALVVLLGERVGLYRAGDLNFRFLFLIVAIIVQRFIRRYYQQHFGEISIERKRSELLWFGILTAALIADNYLRWQVSLFGFSTAGFWLYHWWKSEGLRPHYAVMSVITAAASFLPLFITPLETAYAWKTLIIIGLAIVGMIFDHLLLVRLMQHSKVR